jgi:hypothetical protein
MTNILSWELLQIKLLHNRCKRMKTIIVSWQNGIRFSVKQKLSLHKHFPSKLSWNKYIVSNWRSCCNTFANSFQSVFPETFRNPFPSFRCKCTVSVLVRKRFVASGPFQKRCNIVAKSLLHKRRVETFLSVSAGFSLQIHFKQKVTTDISAPLWQPIVSIMHSKYSAP